MGLEAVMVLADNSEYLRNGDYAPTRLEAQNDAINYVANHKLNQNMESNVGLLSMAGDRVQLHTSMCRSMASIMTSLKEQVHVGGTANFIAGLKVAQLVLKNRSNKTQKQRIIMFVGSPFDVEEKIIVKLGKSFKKNGIAVDVVNFAAENEEHEEKLQKFITSCNSSDNCCLVNAPPQANNNLRDKVRDSMIVRSAGEAGASVGGASADAFGGGGGGGADFGGMEEEDPELAMALRLSLEEDRQRQGRETAASTPAPETPAPAAAAVTAVTAGGDAAAMEDEESEEDEEDEKYNEMLLQQALALSLAAAGGDPEELPEEVTAAIKAPASAAMTDDGEGDADDVNEAINDPAFLQDLLASTGVGEDEVELDDILNNLVGGDDDDEDEDL